MTSRADIKWQPYVSVDLETTGLNPEYCQILEVGAVIDSWHTPVYELPRFHRFIRPNDEIDGEPYLYGSPFALALNAEIIRKLALREPDTEAETCKEDELGSQLAEWLQSHSIDPKHVTGAGKNFASFDVQFLKRLPHFSDHVNFKHRSIDPAVFWWQPDTDECLPSTKECLLRAGLDGRVAHTAVEDCITVIQLIRRGVRKCGLSVAD